MRQIGILQLTPPPLCPFCHKLETVDHALSACQFHALVYDALDKSWALVTCGNKRHTVHTLLVALTRATPLGIMLWTTRQNAAAPTFEAFIKAWVIFMGKVVAWQGLPPLVDAILAFRNALLTLQTTCSLPAHKIVLTRPELSSREKDRKHRKIARKQGLADPAWATLQQPEQQGLSVAWTNGPAKWQAKIGWVGGYGATILGKWETVPLSLPHHGTDHKQN